MKSFLDENFLLNTRTAEKLFHDFAEDLPIIDYHNHLPPNQVTNNKTFQNLTEIWLNGDHYKWRAMRANGISEEYITGSASDYDKFKMWAKTVPYTMRNPLYHWTHLELKRYFGITDILSPETADKIYEEANNHLSQDAFSTKGLLKKMKVEVICTTDEPTDTLKEHLALNEDSSDLKMLPTFRPDKFIQIEHSSFLTCFKNLESVENTSIKSYDQYISALENRITYFHNAGCRLCDHGLGSIPASSFNPKNLDLILSKRIRGEVLNKEEITSFQSAVLFHLAELYYKKDWVMQFHLGAIRNNNNRLLNTVGADVGCDSIGDYSQAVSMSKFFNALDSEQKLCRTIIYNLNPGDNEVFATMAGNYNDGTMPGKIQWGSAWWFLDQKDGMEKQLNTLSNMGLLSRFIGMLTDSRSFLSFPRHEYFRRILCDLIGSDVENGLLPPDIPWLGEMVENISYYNAKRYFNF